MAVAMVCGNPEPKAKADPGVIAAAYTAPLVYERSFHGNLAYPYASAPYVAASPYIAASPYVASPYVASPYVAAPYTAPFLYK